MKRSIFALVSLLILLPSADAARDSVGRDFPVYDNGGKPDLTVDPKRLENQMQILDRYFDPVDDACVFAEFAVGGTGYRRLLRFDTVIVNGGDGDLILGDRSDPANPYAPWFYFAECHQHWHIRDFSEYELVTRDGTTVVAGEKQGFCFEDSFKYGDNPSNGYHCEYQGITSGWGDWYYKQLPGQWIDITGVPEGDYLVRCTIDEAGMFDEGEDRYPNVIEVPVHVPKPRNKVDGEP